jgi:guanylate kinase
MNVEKNEKIIIVGASGSGKDHLLRGLVKKGLRYSPKYTTRPKRKLETNGQEYFFIENSDFESMLESNQIFTYQRFDIFESVWFYSISKDNFQDNQVFIMTPHELSKIDAEIRKGCFVVYLDIDYNIRKSRIVGRNENSDSVDRRLASDEEDFKNFKDYDLRITDSDFEVDMVYDLMN